MGTPRFQIDLGTDGVKRVCSADLPQRVLIEAKFARRLRPSRAASRRLNDADRET